jgi:hypothetical protein
MLWGRAIEEVERDEYYSGDLLSDDLICHYWEGISGILGYIGLWLEGSMRESQKHHASTRTRIFWSARWHPFTEAPR